MSTGTRVRALAIMVLISAGGYGLYQIGMDRGLQLAAPAGPARPSAPIVSAAGDRAQPLYWHDPMYPQQKFDQPGKSPFMDMDLVPVYAEAGMDEGTVRISPRIAQNLGVRTASVRVGTLPRAVEAVGSVAYNARDVAVVQARNTGFVEKVHVRAPLDAVRRGQALAELYVPDWIAAQQEYLAAKQIVRHTAAVDLDALLDGARQRMRQVGMSETQIAQIEATGELHPLLSLIAPRSGVVTELEAREGMTVTTGTSLFQINDLHTVWVNAAVPEAQAAGLAPGNAVEARAVAYPGENFHGTVNALLPEIDQATRTFTARIELANPRQRLRPGMFVMVTIVPAAAEPMLLIPTEAVIETGKRAVVIVADGDGRFTAVDVEPGAEADGQTEIRKGLVAGQQVVISGQFLMDSEASLKATVTRMGEGSAPTDDSRGGETHHGEATVERIDGETITLSHGPIASLQWGPMTMGFKAPPDGLPPNIAVGDRVTFEIRRAEDRGFEIIAISPTGSTRTPATNDERPGGIQGRQP